MVTCDKVQSYLKSFSWTRYIRLNQNIHGLRIRNSMTTPLSPLMPSKVEQLNMLSRHESSVVEDESDVS